LALNSAVNRLRVFMLDRPFDRAIHLMPLSQKPAPPQSPSRLILPLVKAGSRRTIRPLKGQGRRYAAFSASVTASAPAGMRNGEDASVTACQTASATSLAVVTSTDCGGAEENTCLAQSE